jgi:hypothetical protein
MPGPRRRGGRHPERRTPANDEPNRCQEELPQP